MQKQSNNNLESPKPRRLAVISRTLCGLVFLAAATLVLLDIFGVIVLGVNIGIMAALTALAIVVIYSALHLFWPGVWFILAAMVTIMNANQIWFNLDGGVIGNIFIAAALLTVACFVLFRRSRFSLTSFGGDESTTFGSSVKYFEYELDKARLECNFGTIKAYFENAKPKHGRVDLDLECNFGNIELYLPKNWRVINGIETAFGGTVEKNKPSLSEKSPVITLSGEVNFGGLTITYV